MLLFNFLWLYLLSLYLFFHLKVDFLLPFNFFTCQMMNHNIRPNHKEISLFSFRSSGQLRNLSQNFPDEQSKGFRTAISKSLFDSLNNAGSMQWVHQKFLGIIFDKKGKKIAPDLRVNLTDNIISALQPPSEQFLENRQFYISSAYKLIVLNIELTWEYLYFRGVEQGHKSWRQLRMSINQFFHQLLIYLFCTFFVLFNRLYVPAVNIFDKMVLLRPAVEIVNKISLLLALYHVVNYYALMIEHSQFVHY